MAFNVHSASLIPGAKRRSRNLIGAVVALLGLAPALACEPVAGGANPEVPLWMHRPSYSISVTYQKRIVSEARRKGEPYERGQPTIDGAHRRVFIGSSDRGLYALRAEDGDIIWRFETTGAVQSEPLYDAEEDVVYFGSNDGALYKVRASDGGLLFRFMSNAEVSRRPVLSDGLLYVVNANDTLLALDPRTGERRWSQHRAPALGMEVARHSGALVHGGSVYMAFSDGSVAAYDKRTGTERWEPVDLSLEAEQVLGEVPKYLDVDSTPVAATVDGIDAILVGSYEAGVYALESDSGSQLWANNAALGVTDVTLWSEPQHQDRNGIVHPARELLLVSTGTTGLWALDVQTGAEVWRNDLPDGGTERPVPISGAVLVATSQQGIYLVSPRDGSVIDGLYTGVGFSMPPAVLGQRAYILSNSGDLMALSVAPPISDPASTRSFP